MMHAVFWRILIDRTPGTGTRGGAAGSPGCSLGAPIFSEKKFGAPRKGKGETARFAVKVKGVMRIRGTELQGTPGHTEPEVEVPDIGFDVVALDPPEAAEVVGDTVEPGTAPDHTLARIVRNGEVTPLVTVIGV